MAWGVWESSCPMTLAGLAAWGALLGGEAEHPASRARERVRVSRVRREGVDTMLCHGKEDWSIACEDGGQKTKVSGNSEEVFFNILFGAL